MNRWWRAASSPSSISPRSAGCGSRNRRRGFEVNEAVIGGPAPRVGEHSREVLRELGYADSAIDKMISDRAVRVSRVR